MEIFAFQIKRLHLSQNYKTVISVYNYSSDHSYKLQSPFGLAQQSTHFVSPGRPGVVQSARSSVRRKEGRGFREDERQHRHDPKVGQPSVAYARCIQKQRALRHRG